MQSKTIKNFLLFALLVAAISTLLIPRSAKHISPLPSAQAAATRKLSAHAPPPRQPKASVSPLSQTPSAFVENRGQANARAAFLVQGSDTTAHFTAGINVGVYALIKRFDQAARGAITDSVLSIGNSMRS